MGSPWCAPLSNLKYFVVLASFIMHDSWLTVFIHLMNVLQNPYLFKAQIKN